MTSAYANGSAKAAYSSSSATTTALSRWSIATKQLPAVDKIKSLHIYDFDNTRMNPHIRFALARESQSQDQD
ncbi:tat pathway signal sequence [Colletotrichum tofieldiae]|uniref:Uncharacterized protein n=1 Tax=Colletotrichum liriopes TaxID=708192 RepID=A0AA37GB10_9PEZI|nr:hypothetical protein ColLi_00434 [Colletotrichum liriopes]GKT55733.1 tat pathway signal sequence [Colletotrichum tofieldiae]GKT79431.1 tat pathway signal sequence [Colletotrichum tofieldiae]GKT82608.1 tat pathway signal sequence [Colletotrichum tofieldiae]